MRRRLDWWILDRDTGRSVLFQPPNPALFVFAASYVLRWFTGERLDTQLSHIGMGALIVWGLDEVLRGTAPFRRVLGVVVLGWQLMRLFAG
ncbi:MAG: hypothetical protein M3Q98_16835 [Actinomycetota bacterium]|nr:hypothetical protein [Actinomycetota bacterium]